MIRYIPLMALALLAACSGRKTESNATAIDSGAPAEAGATARAPAPSVEDPGEPASATSPRQR